MRLEAIGMGYGVLARGRGLDARVLVQGDNGRARWPGPVMLSPGPSCRPRIWITTSGR